MSYSSYSSYVARYVTHLSETHAVRPELVGHREDYSLYRV